MRRVIHAHAANLLIGIEKFAKRRHHRRVIRVAFLRRIGTAAQPAREAIDDPEPYVPGSFDDVVLAYDLGWLSDADYDVLAIAADVVPGS